MKDFIYQSILIAMPILLGYVVWLLKQQATERMETERKHKEQAEKNDKGVMLLLRIQLIEYHDKYMRKGTIPSYVYENFVDMYDAYHALGGNGTIDKMYTEIKELKLNKKGGSSDESKNRNDNQDGDFDYCTY